mmetsp:Transcript_41001/g.85563  ORF Transcript_41001/g.85563 Transcript_41001/m.85563 type:complete len:219 (+) Transcript_41001:3486-4142(+)
MQPFDILQRAGVVPFGDHRHEDPLRVGVILPRRVIPLKNWPQGEPVLGDSEGAVQNRLQLGRNVSEITIPKGLRVLQAVAGPHRPKYFEFVWPRVVHRLEPKTLTHKVPARTVPKTRPRPRRLEAKRVDVSSHKSHAHSPEVLGLCRLNSPSVFKALARSPLRKKGPIVRRPGAEPSPRQALYQGQRGEVLAEKQKKYRIEKRRLVDLRGLRKRRAKV